jgi:hypothetical protein
VNQDSRLATAPSLAGVWQQAQKRTAHINGISTISGESLGLGSALPHSDRGGRHCVNGALTPSRRAGRLRLHVFPGRGSWCLAFALGRFGGLRAARHASRTGWRNQPLSRCGGCSTNLLMAVPSSASRRRRASSQGDHADVEWRRRCVMGIGRMAL